MKSFLIFTILSFVISSTQILAQSSVKPARTITINTTEGSGMNIDVSPDGKMLAFDLLGEIFMLPATGGKAKQLTHGLAVNTKPVWSPDGRYIAFLSDIPPVPRIINYHADKEHYKLYLRIIDTQGNDIFQHLSESITIYDRPLSGNAEIIWFPDGRLKVDNNVYFPFSGKSPIRANVSFNRMMSRNGLFVFNQGFKDVGDDNRPFIEKIEYSTGKKKLVFQSSRSYDTISNLRITPDEKMIVYLKGQNLINGVYKSPAGNINELICYDLNSETENGIAKLNINYLGQVQSQRYSFSPDSKFVYIGYGGKIHKISLLTGNNKIVPFNAEVKLETGRTNYNQIPFGSDTVGLGNIQDAVMQPDNQQLVFTALNQLYKQSVSGGKAIQLCPQPFTQLAPSYSPDGKWVAYISLIDSSGGDIWRVHSSGGVPVKISKVPGWFKKISWAPDGKSLIVTREEFIKNPNGSKTKKSLLEELNIESGDLKLIHEGVFTESGATITMDKAKVYFTLEKAMGIVAPNKKVDGVVYVDLKTNREYIVGDFIFNVKKDAKFRSGFQVSPDEKYVIYEGRGGDIYLSPIDTSFGKSTLLFSSVKKLQVIRFVHQGLNPRWENGGKAISWLLGNKYYSVSLDKVIKNAFKSDQYLKKTEMPFKWYIDAPVLPDFTLALDVTKPVNKGDGVIAFTKARIISMTGSKIIESGTVVVKDRKILSIGKSDLIKIPSNATLINCKGKTIIPGLIDMHYHDGESPYLQSWRPLVNLSYGVTTRRVPGGFNTVPEINGLIDAGVLIGPRLFGAGTQIREDDLINSLDEARRIVNFQKAAGVVVIKEYDLKDRQKELWIQQAAFEAGVNITHEGAKELLFQIAMIKDGTTGIEHATNWGEVYEDIIQLYTKSGIFLTPVLSFSYSSFDQSRFYLRRSYLRNPDLRYRKFMPYTVRKSLENQIPEVFDSSRFVIESSVLARIRKAGGNILSSSHGNEAGQGIGNHFEIWALQMGGLSNYQALEAATIQTARGLGIQKYLGSLEPGKIADLIILDKNPLENIRNTTSIKYVMKDGILYDSNSMDTVWPIKKKFTGYTDNR